MAWTALILLVTGFLALVVSEFCRGRSLKMAGGDTTGDCPRGRFAYKAGVDWLRKNLQRLPVEARGRAGQALRFYRVQTVLMWAALAITIAAAWLGK